MPEPIVICGAADPRWRIIIRGEQFIARHDDVVEGPYGLYSVRGLIEARDLFVGAPVHFGHAIEDIGIETTDGQRITLNVGTVLKNRRVVDMRPVVGRVIGPVIWNALSWELLAAVEPETEGGARLLAYGRANGWGFSPGLWTSVERYAGNGKIKAPIYDLFTKAESVDLVPVSSLGGRFGERNAHVQGGSARL